MTYRVVFTVIYQCGDLDVFIERFPTRRLAIERGEQMMDSVRDPCHFDRGVPKHCDYVVERVEKGVPV